MSQLTHAHYRNSPFNDSNKRVIGGIVTKSALAVTKKMFKRLKHVKHILIDVLFGT